MTSQRKQRSFTFVELIAATAILAICIVPATKFLADSLTMRRELEQQRTMVILAIQMIEEQMAVINGAFTTTDEKATFASQGLPTLAYRVRRRDESNKGGIPGLLMAIEVEVWEDTDGDLHRDPDEPRLKLHTKMARSVES